MESKKKDGVSRGIIQTAWLERMPFTLQSIDRIRG
jgi:hypothetical protein